MKSQMDKPIYSDYLSDGFGIGTFFTPNQHEKLSSFCAHWLASIVGVKEVNLRDVSNYQNWPKKITSKHSTYLSAKNRHCIPPEHVSNLIYNNEIIQETVERITGKFEVWDEGLGWLAFRLVRPKEWNDGYELSCKEWGPGNKLLSFCFPIVQTNTKHHLGCVRGSHLKRYSAKPDTSNKFCREELRLDLKKHPVDVIYPEIELGQGLFFGSKLLHCERPSDATQTTRFSLEVRFVM